MNKDELSAFLKERINTFSFSSAEYIAGTVENTGDGIAHIKGLKSRKYGELLKFAGGAVGMAMELNGDSIGAVLFDDTAVNLGETVTGTGEVAVVPVGNELLGRITDPLGNPLDGKELSASKYFPIERNAPAIMDRRPVDKPLQTGIIAIDSMIPIGRGQRELIIGDRQTGKTTVAVDSIINQKGKGVICVYCAIGQKASSVALVAEELQKSGAMDYTVIVSATASDSPAMQYLAPFSACSIAEYFEEQGRDVLIVYDDLSKHAVAYRTMSLLLLRPPGREAFPGDIFYLHSRLLERSACLSEKNGGGSITALPIVETMSGNISAYIPTNIISITDGQIFLESKLFHSGVRPAVNTGLSVSRVGRAAQYPAMKAVSGTLRIELAQYRETEVFASFGSDIDNETKKLLNRGKTLINIFKQGKNSPYSLFDEVCLLLAFSNGYFAGTEEKDFAAAKEELLKKLREVLEDTRNSIIESGEMSDDEKNRIISAVNELKSGEVQ